MILLTRLIQLILVAIPFVIMGWLLNLWFVPSGTFFVGHEVGQSSPFIDELKPETRVSILRGQVSTGEYPGEYPQGSGLQCALLGLPSGQWRLDPRMV